MTTPRDLLIITMDVSSTRPVEQGDLSLALAGAELVDLLGALALTLDDDRIVPGPQGTVGDRLLDEAASSLVRQQPYESVEDRLWRRGRDLSSAYLADLEAEGRPTPRRHRWIPGRTDRPEPTDSPARRRATDRLTSGEPVLAALAAAVGIQDAGPEEATTITDDSVATVLAAVHDAITELEAVRQRKRVEDAAFDNIWRGM
ncbi:GPP34 family phosphoprotein [Streptomyces sp. NPDC087263]|uniref:GOLPH3/VPS74 family protein n=1 Tax=Streptomyces sp. NPDC087263 TaxID=3365773 RepID=UPI00381482E5